MLFCFCIHLLKYIRLYEDLLHLRTLRSLDVSVRMHAPRALIQIISFSLDFLVM